MAIFWQKNNLVFLWRHIKFICTYVNFQDMNSEFEFNNNKKHKAQEEHINRGDPGWVKVKPRRRTEGQFTVNAQDKVHYCGSLFQ